MSPIFSLFLGVGLNFKNDITRNKGSQKERWWKMPTETLISFVSVLIAFLCALLSLMNFKKDNQKEIKQEGKKEQEILSRIEYIKECLERVEENVNLINEKYQSLIQRISKLEERNKNLQK